MARRAKPLSVARLERRLRNLLSSPKAQLSIRPLANASASVTWEGQPPDQIKITVDPDREGRIRCVAHELLHVVFSDDLRTLVDDDLDELIILALENAIVDYIKDSKPRLAAWRRAIEAKLT